LPEIFHAYGLVTTFVSSPGRFFAAVQLKAMMAHLVINYDIKLENAGARPDDMWIVSACVPNISAEVMFRKRQT
jgi:hypothetical protein